MSHALFYMAEVKLIADELDTVQVDLLVDKLVALRDRGGRLFLVGLGGSAANCSHAASDFRKLTGIQAISLSDNVAELTARANDEGFGCIYTDALEAHKPTRDDSLFVLSVGGGSGGVSEPLVRAVMKAKQYGMDVLGVVGRDGGYTKEHGDLIVLVPNMEPSRVTPHTEAFQMVILHALVSDPLLQRVPTKW